MENKEYAPPITISKLGELIQVAYDQVSVSFPPDGPIPEGAPALACRIFEAYRRDLQTDLHAE
ncbi:hypothetical protein [Streptomyces cucumeris]|uniref:hypothetical protein n=1 Tax=Streptomyces cucumeris TaxID=2962890 RepID=UPI0020C85250|nr:hypothetical protein [Streptomyces sp. NEAU-Y11]MCP9209724.1 hypothetical protein [Streptomyces sp. NEAU-Y11]